MPELLLQLRVGVRETDGRGALASRHDHRAAALQRINNLAIIYKQFR